jgi:hypothetical protein
MRIAVCNSKSARQHSLVCNQQRVSSKHADYIWIVQEQCESLLEDYDSDIASELLQHVGASGFSNKQTSETERKLETAICEDISSHCDGHRGKDEL